MPNRNNNLFTARFGGKCNQCGHWFSRGTRIVGLEAKFTHISTAIHETVRSAEGAGDLRPTYLDPGAIKRLADGLLTRANQQIG